MQTDIAGNIIEFDDASHTYWVNGVITPGVTDIINSFAGPKYFTEASTLRGKFVHEYIDCHAKGIVGNELPDHEHAGYIAAYLSFCKEWPHEIIDSEFVVFHPDYCGTADRIVRAPGLGRHLIDFKTGAPSWTHAVQVYAYSFAFKHMTGYFTEPLLVYLRADGKYNMATKISYHLLSDFD